MDKISQFILSKKYPNIETNIGVLIIL